MNIAVWMAFAIIFMFMLLVYGLVHQNRFIVYSSIVGIIVYFIVLQPVLTKGGSIREAELKEQWGEIQSESKGDYSDYLTLFKTTFVHDQIMTEQLAYYTFTLSYYDELLSAIEYEQSIEGVTAYNVALHNTLKERISFYESVEEQNQAQLSKDEIYKDIHKRLELVLADLKQLNANNEALQGQLELATAEEQQEIIIQYTDKQKQLFSSLNRNQTQVEEQLKKLTNHIESAISYRLKY